MAGLKEKQDEEELRNTDYGKGQQMDPAEQAQQLQNAQAALNEIGQIEEQGRILQQQNNNKAHDTELSGASVNGTGAAAGSVGGAYGTAPETLGVIGEEEIHEAFQTLMKYKEEKAQLEGHIQENEEFFKLNHWMIMNGGNGAGRVQPKSAWLFDVIHNKVADAMDNFPEANVLPRAQDDEKTADVLSDVIPVILEQNDYEATYEDCQWYKIKNGTSVQAVTWNNERNNGLGDVDIEKVDLLNVFWKGGVKDIQDSPNFFRVVMMDNDEIKSRWPEIKTGNGSILGLTSEETYHQNYDTSDQSAVIDWYYKRRVNTVDDFGIQKVQTVLHYAKFCNDQLIYASENDPIFADRGWYDHGLYPFVFDCLFPMEGTATGMGYIDIIKDDQLYIDKLQQAILESAITNARPRYVMRNDGSINEKEFLDLSKPIVHADGNLGEDSLRALENSAFNSVYETVYLNKIQELKDTSGNTAASQGQASSVTSASGIASLQEAAGKLSRLSNAASYRAYKQVVNLVIELIRQFYDEPRCFRISGDKGQNEFITFDNSGLRPQPQGMAFGMDLGNRLPIMDIDVKPQKRNAYSKESQNQTALNLYNMGFFAPQNADAALACLDMMEFDQIDKLRDKVESNGTMYQVIMQQQMLLQQYQQQLMQLGVIVDAQNGTNIAGGVAQSAEESAASAAKVAASGSGQKKTGSTSSRGSLSTQAASATRGSATPR